MIANWEVVGLEEQRAAFKAQWHDHCANCTSTFGCDQVGSGDASTTTVGTANCGSGSGRKADAELTANTAIPNNNSDSNNTESNSATVSNSGGDKARISSQVSK